ncbi:MAG: class I SAM-dependent methyltransferase [Methanobacteriota archaeon]|nr:MAG: class I SAM-dependent methyltransferase [Euryarchaeota archaeon]
MEIPKRVKFDRVADIYDETRAIPEPFFTKALDVMEDYLDKQGMILDLGCGTGRFARPLQKRGLNVVGIDISEKMLDVGVSKGLYNASFGDACCVPFKDGAFHSTISVHLLHLVPDWLEILEEIVRVTRTNFLTHGAFWPDIDNPNLQYDRIIEESGHKREPLGVIEKDLTGTIEPYANVYIGTRNDMVPAEERISRLEDRIYSGQWSIPEDIHREAIDKVRNRFEGEMVEMRADMYVFVWKIEDLSDAIEKIRSEK